MLRLNNLQLKALLRLLSQDQPMILRKKPIPKFRDHIHKISPIFAALASSDNKITFVFKITIQNYKIVLSNNANVAVYCKFAIFSCKNQEDFLV